MAREPYDERRHRRAREVLLKDNPACWKCGRVATTIDHVPPLSTMPRGEWEGELRPACTKCNYGHGLNARRRRPGGITPGKPTFVRPA